MVPGTEQEPSPVRILSAGIDSLYVAWDFSMAESRRRELERRKVAALKAHRVPVDPRTGELLEILGDVFIELGGAPWKVKHYGGQSATYLVQNELAQLGLSPDGGTAPTMTAKILAQALWSEDTDRLLALLDAVVRDLAWGDVERRYVQTIDVCVDFQGWVPRPSDFEKFSVAGNATRTVFDGSTEVVLEESLEPRTMWARGALTGFRVGLPGKSASITRLYDKGREIVASRKPWFRKIWARSPDYVPDEPVWRAEASARREFLKGMRDDGLVRVEEVEDVIEARGAIFQTILLNRARLTKGDKAKPTNSSTNPAWEQIATTHHVYGSFGGQVTRVEQDLVELEGLWPTIRGYLARVGSLTGQRAIDDVLVTSGEAIAKICEERDEPFGELVEEKARVRVDVNKAARIADEMEKQTKARRAENVRRLFAAGAA